MNINVDTLKLAVQLEAGGFTTEQARVLASALGEAAQVADLVKALVAGYREPALRRNVIHVDLLYRSAGPGGVHSARRGFTCTNILAK